MEHIASAPSNSWRLQFPLVYRFLDPTTHAVPSFDKWLEPDFRQNARGIYYDDQLPRESVLAERKLFVPSFEGIDWDCQDKDQVLLRKRARIVARHSLSNQAINKSEYVWEADAWKDVFGVMRNDPLLAM